MSACSTLPLLQAMARNRRDPLSSSRNTDGVWQNRVTNRATDKVSGQLLDDCPRLFPHVLPRQLPDSGFERAPPAARYAVVAAAHSCS